MAQKGFWPVKICAKGSVLAQVAIENEVEPADPSSHEKWPIKRDGGGGDNEFKREFLLPYMELYAFILQYPGVAESINSDINNLVSLLKVWEILPKGWFMYTCL